MLAQGTGFDESARATPLWLYKFSVLPVFFALSGFLVTGSAGRLSLREFLTNRGLRIVPALAVEVLLSAFVLGAIFTSSPLREYVLNSQLYGYLLNMVGDIHYFLPGVFEDNPYPGVVNGSLWTVPYELGCYALISVLILTKAITKPAMVAGAIILYYVGSMFWSYTRIPDALPHLLRAIGRFGFSDNQNALSGPNLFPFFLTGSLFYLLRDKIAHDVRIFVACVVALIVVACVGSTSWQTMPIVQALLCPLLVYCLVFVGVTALAPPSFLKRGDYSYGIYLYGFPIQQALVAALPSSRLWYLNLLLTLPLLLAFSMLSWRFIEKPIVLLRKKHSFLAKRLEEDSRPTNAAEASSELSGSFGGKPSVR